METNMPKPINKTILTFVILFIFIAAVVMVNTPLAAQLESMVFVPSEPVAEAKDFATLRLGDPWDMSEYSDVSKYINEAGERDVLRNIITEDGVFKATSIGDVLTGANGWFHVLFPGYETSVHVGKVGSATPIDSSQYQCLYMALKTNSPAANQFGPDQYRVFWWGDDRINTQGAPYGFTQGIALYPEHGAATPTPIWKLYKIDLANTPMPPEVPGLVRWQDKATWQGIRIDPTINANVDFAVDWVRLTSCQPHLVPITFTPNAGITALWLRPINSDRRILVGTGVNGASGSYQLDIQGIQAGEYKVGFGTHGANASCCVSESSTNLKINQTPIVQFTNPTLYTGEDFATTSGNAWDMEGGDDLVSVECISSHWFSDNALWFVTPTDSQQPPHCVGGPPEFVGDARIRLNMPNGRTINPMEYRYLSFRMYDGQPWQRIPRGSMARLIWTIQGDSGRLGYECHLVSQDITFNVGWNIYTIDLWETFAGSAEEWAGECDSLPKNWRDSSPVMKLRFDPNENITSGNFQQAIDWLRITKPNRVKKGVFYPIGLDNFFPDQAPTISLYYTTNPATQPKQHVLMVYEPQPPGEPPVGDYYVYLPFITNGLLPAGVESDYTYLWDTSQVALGEYYICAESSDGLNTAIFCSKASITVTP